MKFLQVLKEAFISINSNRTRSFLTILGIVIGVGAVIGLMSIGEGAQSTITGQIESIGTNVMYVMPGNSDDDVTNPKNLTLADTDALENRNRGQHIAGVSPILNATAQVKYGGESLNTSIIGGLTAYQKIASLELAEGSFFTKSQVDSNASVVVIGPELAERVIGRTTDVVGTILRINGYPFRVIGVTIAKGGSQFNNPDLSVYMPITSMQQRVKKNDVADKVDYIIVQAQGSQNVDAAIQEVSDILRDSHRLSPRQANDFTITNQEDILSIAGSITSVLTIFLSGIAGISLLVGGIGIMNIMLVTVTERTREIGLRKALGAKKKVIIRQFLMESVILTFVGGILGIIFGILASFIYARANSATFYISPASIALAFAVSAAIGIIFGWYPARRASNLQPIEALRYE